MIRKNIRNVLLAATAAFFTTSLCMASDNASSTPEADFSNALIETAVGFSAPAFLPGLGDIVLAAAANAERTVHAIDVASLLPALAVEPAGLPSDKVAMMTPSRPTRLDSGASNDSVFKTVAIPFKRLAALEKFAPSLNEMRSGHGLDCAARGCHAADAAVKVAEGKTARASLRDKIEQVNYTVNHAIRYASDMQTYHVTDYWAKPSETLSRQQGDCEDFAILKMSVLHAEGVSLDDMALVILFDQQRHFYHAVLSVSVEGRRLILDNMRDQVLADRQITSYLPLYSIVDGRGFLHGSRDPHALAMASAVPLTKIAPGEGATN
ncbi:transglutaminase-like cysteine peptidase [Rhizobium sp. HT1-10]|uniref:transglutaminase-like cysteine peptidase n=1 Tax=Rhizobium sp. HT1-10 TaxID=3111638 RepID=UPI003C2FD0CF